MSTFFRGTTETVPSLFRGIFSEQKSVANLSETCDEEKGLFNKTLLQRNLTFFTVKAHLFRFSSHSSLVL
jgi:hypothetical protein